MCSVCDGLIPQCDCPGGDNVYYTNEDIYGKVDNYDPEPYDMNDIVEVVTPKVKKEPTCDCGPEEVCDECLPF